MIRHLVRSDSEVSDQVQRKIRTEAEHWAAEIQAATLRAKNKIQQLEVAGLTSSSPKDPYYAKVLNRGNPITDKRSAPAGQTLAYNINARRTPKPPDKIWLVNTNDSSVASTNGH